MKQLIRRGGFFILFAGSLAFFPSGCGSDTPDPITLTGTLDGARGALAGYKFKCVTLTNPPFSGTATADSTGAFSLNFSAAQVPFGCFVLDTNDAQVATTFFTSSTENATSQTITIAGTNSLGTVTVDTSRGKATATVPAATKKGADGLDCPVGVWSGTVGVNDIPCAGETVTLTLWIGKDTGGNYTVSQALDLVGPGTCGTSTHFPTAGTFSYSSGSTSASLSYAINFSGHPATATITIPNDCNEMSLTMTQTGCTTSSCGPPDSLVKSCQGSGSETCNTNVFRLFKQK